MAESLLITCLPDGTFHVKETEDQEDGDPQIDQSVKAGDDVLQLVQQWLDGESQEDDGQDMPEDSADSPAGADASGDAAPDMASAWKQEAKTRSPSGFRKQGA